MQILNFQSTSEMFEFASKLPNGSQELECLYKNIPSTKIPWLDY